MLYYCTKIMIVNRDKRSKTRSRFCYVLRCPRGRFGAGGGDGKLEGADFRGTSGIPTAAAAGVTVAPAAAAGAAVAASVTLIAVVPAGARGPERLRGDVAERRLPPERVTPPCGLPISKFRSIATVGASSSTSEMTEWCKTIIPSAVRAGTSIAPAPSACGSHRTCVAVASAVGDKATNVPPPASTMC
jgi:hypothetical protein